VTLAGSAAVGVPTAYDVCHCDCLRVCPLSRLLFVIQARQSDSGRETAACRKESAGVACCTMYVMERVCPVARQIACAAGRSFAGDFVFRSSPMVDYRPNGQAGCLKECV
jgi:hypothetical protein